MLPVALTLLPVIATLPLGDESFHKALLLLVIPASAVGLSLGCKKASALVGNVWGISGLVVMSLAAMFGHDLLGEAFEKGATLFGALLVAGSHLANFRRFAGPLTANNL